MKRFLLALFLISTFTIAFAQDSVKIDGRLQPLLKEFFKHCEAYGIPYHTKLFQLKSIDISNTLPLEEGSVVMGMVKRNDDHVIEHILVNWIASVDPEILKIVAFHEFAHHFLDYKHTCTSCDEIMAENNVSYFNVAKDWDNQVHQLFITSPVYLDMQAKISAVNMVPSP
ncbi:hypothetical protein [Croceivirga sp. JEA036]|uniref:hypothetical protein n=1 Tax=Croceivirga sp. JEA036 TaxID=2721162 RepID=UPI00143BF16C|nr:hypothetical protein [Croceivirga sp. JEA036]NJB36527.1 hypothetical protein [Croceivirga sp. JEA036]